MSRKKGVVVALWLLLAGVVLSARAASPQVGEADFGQWTGVRLVDKSPAALLDIPGEAVWKHPAGTSGWHRVGFRWMHDGGMDLRDSCGLQFDVVLKDDRPVSLDVTIKAPRAMDARQEYVLSSRTSAAVRGAGRHTVTLPWSQFDFQQAQPAFLKFIHEIHIAARFPDGSPAGTMEISQPRAVAGEIIGLRSSVRGRTALPGGCAEYAVTVENCTDQRQAVALAMQRQGWEAVKARVEPALLLLGPGETGTCTVRVEMPARMPPGGREKQTLAASVNGRPAGSLTFTTARDVEHPYLLHTRQRWDEVRAKVKQYDWAKKSADETTAKAARWQVPETALKRITPDDGMGEYLFVTSVEEDLLACATAWQLTGDKAHAGKVALFLRRLSDPQRGYPRTLRGCNQGIVQEGHFIKNIMQCYDAILDAGVLTEADRAQIAATLRLFIETIEFEASTGNVSNWIISEESGALFASLMLGDWERAERFYSGPNGLLDQYGKGTMDDGWWFECAVSYNGWMASLGTEIALAVEPWGENMLTMKIPNGHSPNFGLMPWQMESGLYGMSFEKWGPLKRSYVQLTDLWNAFLPFLDWRGVIFGTNDSEDKLISGNRYEQAYWVYRDPRYAAMIRYSPARDLLWGVPELPKSDPELYRTSAAADNAGLVVLRSQTPDRPQRERIQAVLKYGTHGGFHGHFDRASLLSVMRYGRSFFHPEMVWYGYDSFLYKFYVQSSLTKNMVVVDDKMQEPVESRQLLFHSGPALQVSCVETKARWSYPPYGGMVYDYIPEARTFADKLRIEGRSLDIPTNAPPYGEVTGYTEPVLQRRLLAVTDDYLLLADYLKSEKEHTFDLLHQIKGFRGIESAACRVMRHTAAMDGDPLNAAQLVTDCDWYEVSGPAVARFEMDFTGTKDKESGFNDRNDPGALFMDVHAAWPAAKREMMVGTVPENLKGVRRKVQYSAVADGKTLAGGTVGVWTLGEGRVDVPLAGEKEILLSALPERRGDRKTLFWTRPILVNSQGDAVAIPDSAISLENVEPAPSAGQDYEGGPVKIAGSPCTNAIPAEPKEDKKPAVVRINLQGLDARRFKTLIGGDFPFDDEQWRRKTLAVRSQGREARFLTVIEPYESKAAVKKVEAADADHVRVELADGRVQELVIEGLESAGGGVAVRLLESRGGQRLREEAARSGSEDARR